MKKSILAMTIAVIAMLAPTTFAAKYKLDTEGSHAFVQFRIKHLGYSWLYGRFNQFSGEFNFDDKKPEDTKISVTIDTNSIDSNHAERDKHLRSRDFLDTKRYPQARFTTSAVKMIDATHANLSGDLTLHGVTKPVTIAVEMIGQGPDPWGGQRVGFAGTTTIKLKDYNIMKDLGPASQEVELFFSLEGIRQ